MYSRKEIIYENSLYYRLWIFFTFSCRYLPDVPIPGRPGTGEQVVGGNRMIVFDKYKFWIIVLVVLLFMWFVEMLLWFPFINP